MDFAEGVYRLPPPPIVGPPTPPAFINSNGVFYSFTLKVINGADTTSDPSGEFTYESVGGSDPVAEGDILKYTIGNNSVPEPATLAIWGLAGLGLLAARRRRQS